MYLWSEPDTYSLKGRQMYNVQHYINQTHSWKTLHCTYKNRNPKIDKFVVLVITLGLSEKWNRLTIRLKPCLHQPCDTFFLANSYDLNRKPIAGRSQRPNTIAEIARQPYDVRTPVEQLSYGPYEIAGLRIANSHGSPTNSQNFLVTVVRPVRSRTSVIRTRRMLFHACFFFHTNIF